ncbi:MAG TPA: hypothetical protein VII06_31500 [Chloroflexota bacterium]|jgi:hypothetical protein
MALAKLKGRTVQVWVSEPWDFGTEHGCGPFRATVLESGAVDSMPGDTVLLRLATALEFKGVRCEYLVATPRHEAPSFASLDSGGMLPANLVRIPEDRAAAPDPLNLDWWRGGVGLVGSLQLAAPTE